MLKRLYYCDACSRQIEADRTELEITCGELLRRGAESIDLCGPCRDRLAAFLSGPSPDLTQPPAPEKATA